MVPVVANAERPQHRRNKSSRSGILKALVSSKSKTTEDSSNVNQSRSEHTSRTQKVPLLPPDHPHARVLGERPSNVQSPPTSPSKQHGKITTGLRQNGDVHTCSKKTTELRPKKSKSTTSLASVFAKMNRSSKDLSTYTAPKDKENETPPSTSNGAEGTPIWAQFADSSSKSSLGRRGEGDIGALSIEDEIAKYTPKNYSPSKQRNFNGLEEQPALRPTLKHRPQSAFVPSTEGLLGAIGRRVSGEITGRKSDESTRRTSKEHIQRDSFEPAMMSKSNRTERKVSGSSTEQAPKEKLNIVKRGGRVMAAVAALQGRNKEAPPRPEPELDPKAVDTAFEAVLDSRNIPEPMRQKMRSLTLRVKADFIRQNEGTSSSSRTGTESTRSVVQPDMENNERDDDFEKTTKRSRPRSMTFTFSRGDRRGDSPTKKQRSQSKSRPTSIHVPKEANTSSTSTPTTPTGSSSRKNRGSADPQEYITYLKNNQDPTKIEVGRLHKLRILLRNETVSWVDSFISLGGMAEVVGLLHRIMTIEWREEHEDQLLHETLLCLKGLCTTERAMAELNKVADELFPALLGMLFDEEKKGPAEYSTRTIIINILFNFLDSATKLTPTDLEVRARRILAYLGEPAKPEDAKPVEFILGMHVPRPYKLWCREVSNVTKEVFWIFLHHLNVVPLPKRPGSSGSDRSASAPSGSTNSNMLEDQDSAPVKTYTQRHFPGLRPPVPAAPYIGGVEWDATTYLTAHLDLMNGLIVSITSCAERNHLREELQASGFEKTLGTTLRTCKEKFYSGVHDALRAWVAAAAEDGWDTKFVREGPTMEEQAARARSVSPKKSPKKKEAPPKLEEIKVEAPKLDFNLGFATKLTSNDDDDDDGWLG